MLFLIDTNIELIFEASFRSPTTFLLETSFSNLPSTQIQIVNIYLLFLIWPQLNSGFNQNLTGTFRG